MSLPPAMRSVLALVACAIAAGALPATVRRGAATSAAGPRFAQPTPASRTQGLRFEGVAPGDERVVLTAVAGARPEARRLLDAVTGLVTVRVGPAGATAAGYTQTTPTGYDVQLDLGLVSQALGSRGIDRLVLHELGHVVRFALVDPALLRTLDAGIPHGYGCEDGTTGACAKPEERFAESFSKWAMGDIGVNLDIGYKVLPPSYGLEAWAAPLTRLSP